MRKAGEKEEDEDNGKEAEEQGEGYEEAVSISNLPHALPVNSRSCHG